MEDQDHSGDQAGGDALLLNEAEVRRLVRLLADALGPEDGRAARCSRLMDGLAEMIDADGWFWMRSRVNAEGGPPVNIDYLYGGAITNREVAIFAERSLEAAGEPPEHPPMRRLLAQGKPFTVERTQLVPDEVWRRGPCAAYVSRLGLDEMLYSWMPLRETDGGTMLSGCVMFRKLGKPSFDERACRLVHLVFQECGPLHTADLNADLVDDLSGLTPRQRTVLAMLIDGMTVKEAAERLSLSPHTVNGYVKAIYRHFGVRNRAGLLRRFMTSGQADAAG